MMAPCRGMGNFRKFDNNEFSSYNHSCNPDDWNTTTNRTPESAGVLLTTTTML
jgi:hypothetical protein